MMQIRLSKIGLIRITTFSFFLIFLGACLPQTEPKSSSTQAKVQRTTTTHKTSTIGVDSSRKYLLTDSSVGLFRLGFAWMAIAKSSYHFQNRQEYGSCVDACCDGGYALYDSNPKHTQDSFPIEQLITIGTQIFEENESPTKYQKDSSVFFVNSDNCRGWYWKDKVQYFIISSNLFRTKENIGVGSTLEQIQKQFGNLRFRLGWIEEDPNAIQVIVNSYPNLGLVLNLEDYLGTWEDISLKGDTNDLTLNSFRPNTKVQRIIIEQRPTQ